MIMTVLGLIKEELQKLLAYAKSFVKEPKYRRLAIALSLLFFYLAGILAQFLNNRYNWSPGRQLYLPSINPIRGLVMLTTPFGMQAMVGLFFFALTGSRNLF